jgi:hypothetical protein
MLAGYSPAKKSALVEKIGRGRYNAQEKVVG